MARANISGGKTANARIIHSEGDGAYDKMLLAMSNGFAVAGQDLTQSRLSNDSMNIYLLVYDIKGGKMAVCFSHTDDARYNGYKQTGTAWMGVLKGAEWVTISRKDDRRWGWNR
ncbi:MAG TPA: hypothetical protein VK474_00675 [Chthoniobacterales bacterium]|nr:hypothetical protein [Chthoniobacterales bacterium]